VTAHVSLTAAYFVTCLRSTVGSKNLVYPQLVHVMPM
jgi:hypothetical protein